MDSPDSSATRGVRSAIESFLQNRLNDKLEKLPAGDPKRQALTEQFVPATWIADAARRVAQLQMVTHSLKPMHPDAKGTSLFVQPSALHKHDDAVGSHVLGLQFKGDVVGNSAALDVYKFLKLEYEDKSLLRRLLEGDGATVAALDPDETVAQAHAEAFTRIVEARGEEASHTRAKQLYWLVGEDPKDNASYHLLAPLYATSLAHEVFETINEDRYGDAAKEARKARREKRYSADGYRDYKGLAVQKLGGTKPQNISQLNSERGGVNYLLASLPPVWRSQGAKPPLYRDSVFPQFGRRREVRWLVGRLSKLLVEKPSANMKTRNQRDSYIAALTDELTIFAAETQAIAPGWSTDTACRLHESEGLWLDIGRAEDDVEFAEKRSNADWQEDVCGRFANWLNHSLQQVLPVGDPEWQYWKVCLDNALAGFQEDMRYV